MRYPQIILVIFILVIGKTGYSYERPKNTQKIDSLLQLIGDIQTNYRDSAFKIIEECERLTLQSKDSVAIAKIKIFKGVDAYLRSSPDEATKLYFEALAIAESIQDFNSQGIIWNNLGSVYFDLKDFDQSENYYNKALTVMTQSKNLNWMSKIHGNLAGIYFMRGQHDRALEALQTSIKFGIEAENYVSVASAYSNLAMVYTSLDRKDEALEQFNLGKNMLDSAGDRRGVCIVLNKIGELQHNLGFSLEAISTINEALHNAKMIGHKQSILDAHGLLSNAFNQIDNDSTVYHLRQYISWKDSVHNSDQIRIIKDLDKKYESAKKKAEIRELKAQKKLSDVREEKQKIRIWLLGSIVGLALLILGFIWRQLRIKREHNKVLESKNEIISDSLANNEVLLKEIHHRVKNNFQLISSILLIQANTPKNELSKDLLLELRQRIQSMSVTHQKLYSTDSISSVDLKAFVTELADELESTHANIPCDLEIKSEDLQISVDAAISVGLILTEAIINAFKHAFHQTDRAKIIISMHVSNKQLDMTILDNGSGFDQATSQESFGTKMIRNMVSKHDGEVEWLKNDGTLLKVILRKI